MQNESINKSSTQDSGILASLKDFSACSQIDLTWFYCEFVDFICSFFCGFTA